MKKVFVLFLCMILVAVTGFMSACGDKNDKQAPKSEKLSIVTTIFPEYDWVCEILGDEADNADITMLLDKGIDLHSYQPTSADIVKISNCDLFIYVGGESDEWVEDVLENADNDDIKVIKLLDVLGDSVKNEESVEGMQTGEHEHDDGDEEEKDEHVWLSLKNAIKSVSAISVALQQIDYENRDAYAKNASVYIEKLLELDKKYKETVDSSARNTLLFGDRFPFRYLVDDYGLKYYAAFVGCSAETEASFETISFLAKKADALKLSSIITIEGANHKIAETIISNTAKKDQKVLIMDSMQSTSAEDIKNGASYLSIMEKNLQVLKEALN